MKCSIFIVCLVVGLFGRSCGIEGIDVADYDLDVVDYGDDIDFDSTTLSSRMTTELAPLMTSKRPLISKLIERGRLLMKSIPRTGMKLAGRVLNFIPTPETIFNIGKQTLIGLPQQLIAYAVNSFCKISFFFVCKSHDFDRQ